MKQYIVRNLRSLLSLILLLAIASLAPAQSATPVDSDHDGLSDALEQTLLTQFAPAFFIARKDCAGIPAEFRPDHLTPSILSENATIYGQVSPAHQQPGANPLVEIHFYHLWRQDCGSHGHPLDTEHVSVLVRASTADLSSAHWKALFWYAAAHENTVCDVSQIARASTLHAEDHGAEVWISPGKHASYLNETLCNRGCGADRCDHMTPLAVSRLINLGEPAHPMNGAAFIASNQWPLAFKMSHTNFPDEPLSRLEALPTTDIAWFSPGRHPAQGVIAISSATEGALADSSQNTSTAISVAADSTGNALDRSYRNTRHALGTSIHHVGKALGLDPAPQPSSPEAPEAPH